MSDGSAVTPESGEQQPQNPSAIPPQAAAPTPQFPTHTQPQQGFDPAAGFPPQAAAPNPSYGYPPAQGGYGYPAAQGGYGYPPLAAPAEEPDWYSLAEQNEASSRKRKRLLLIGGGVLAAAAVAGIVVTTLMVGGDKTPDAGPSASASASGKASPSASETGPAPTTPLEVISSTRTDTASVTLTALFPSPTLNLQGRLYTKIATDLDKDCKAAPVNGLEQTLHSLGCYNVYRATYSNGSGLEITVGVATFASDTRATKAKAGTKGNIAPLVKDTVTAFCQNGVKCATTQSSLGRYAYFTIAGPADGSAVSDKDKAALAAAKDISGSIYENLLERGRTGLAKVTG
ncbi:hypothetical protein GCM10010193_11140 [Kitasatospora atroaurantiaca]|uniref:Uncharacterized protein n=1 Tax=Kitasatospora atroaurantiaca TaxID=285545 RepID=A0A561EQB3_9ACTN|nr:hypothetical protein [Kitasatospora atroaurantiaca]TWE17806.1 hypothetical protein FB465_2844 [Kitasatospora atroaurantiaca]